MSSHLPSRPWPELLSVLDRRASSTPNRVAYTFLRDGDTVSEELTFGELRRRALCIATQFTALRATGERAILCYPPGLGFITAFFGCLYAGVVAVPVSVPARKNGFETLRRVAQDSGARWVLSTGRLVDVLEGGANGAPGSPSVVDSETWRVEPEAPWDGAPLHPGGLALLQYTSGSTGTPRGVAVRHSNLVANLRDVAAAFRLDEQTQGLSWLPMFHDMGLGAMLQATWSGGRCVLMTPQAFLQNPVRWLRAISQFRAQTSGGPDFAYDLCVRRIPVEQRAGLDLSTWRVAFNGSEPVRPATLERFAEEFAPCGFRREALSPVYGLAEATLFVTGKEQGAPPHVASFDAAGLAAGEARPALGSADARALAGCGAPASDTRLLVVDPETREPRPKGTIGEIWVQSASVADGYWQREGETEATFKAKTSEGSGPYLRTGDLGFVLDGQLFVTGRHKDLIIVRGRNHFPQDIEDSVSRAHPALVPHACAAFSVDGPSGEALVLVQEIERRALRDLDAPTVFRAIRAAVSEEHALHTDVVMLVRPSTLPRTSSGKLRRSTCRGLFLDDALSTVASWFAPGSAAAEVGADRIGAADARSSDQADRLVEWLRRNLGDLIAMYAAAGQTTPPPALVQDLAQQGLLGMQVDRRYGGLGLSRLEATRVLEQIAASDFGLSLFFGLNHCLGILPIAEHAARPLRQLLLPALAQGKEVAAFAFQEPTGGDLSGHGAVHARPEGDGEWRLTGTKYLVGAAPNANVVHVFARHDEPPGVSAFVVPATAQGVRRLRDGLSTGVLGFARETIVFEDVRVGRDNVLVPLGAGMAIAREMVLQTRLSIGAACVGSMKRCARLIGRDAPGADGPLDGKRTPNPVTLTRLGSVTASVHALESLVRRTAGAVDAGHAVSIEAFTACRVLGQQLLLRCIEQAMQLGVGRDHDETNQLLFLYRDAGLLRQFDGSPESLAERTGATLMEGDASLRFLIGEVFGVPDMIPRIGRVLEAVRSRMDHLRGPLASRAQRWAHTKTGELCNWLVLLCAVESARREAPSPELTRAFAWSHAEFEQAVSAVTVGTPPESATLDSSDVAAAFAAYTHASPEAAPGSSRRDGRPPLADAADRGAARPHPIEARADEAFQRELRSWIVSWIAARVRVPVSQVESGRSFADHGLDSVASVELAKALSDKLDLALDETLLWNFATIDALVDHFTPRSGADPEVSVSSAPPSSSPATDRAPSGAGRSTESKLEDELSRLEEELRARSSGRSGS